MQHLFEITRTSRKTLLQFLESYTLEQLITTPEGFKNNIIWNIGHVIVIQQLLVYNLSGLPMLVSSEMVHKYKKGTMPEANVTQEELDRIQALLFETIDQTETDFSNGAFKNYKEYTPIAGVVMKSVEDAIAFNYYHEAIHTGMIMGIRKFI